MLFSPFLSTTSTRCHPQIEKTRDTWFSQTLKVEGNKVPLIFLIFAQGLRYDHSVNLQVFPFDAPY